MRAMDFTSAASPASQDVLPEGAALSAARITNENNPAQYAALSEMLQQLYGTENPIAFFAYDIRFPRSRTGSGAGRRCGECDHSGLGVCQRRSMSRWFTMWVDEQGADPALKEIPAEAEGNEGEEQVVFASDSFSVFIVLANGTTLTLADGSGLTYKVIATEADTFTHTAITAPLRGLVWRAISILSPLTTRH